MWVRPVDVGVVDQILSVGVERVVRERRGEGLRALPPRAYAVFGVVGRVSVRSLDRTTCRYAEY